MVKIIAYHGTNQVIEKFRPFSHFGPLEIANSFASGDSGLNGQIYPVELNFDGHLIEINDLLSHNLRTNWEHWAKRTVFLSDKEKSRLFQKSSMAFIKSDHPTIIKLKEFFGEAALAKNSFSKRFFLTNLALLLREKGIAGLKYKNMVEHAGCECFINLHPDQVIFRISKPSNP